MKPLLWDAINPITGRGYAWNDSNLIWGDPSMVLEPGDAGFTPYPEQLTPKTKPISSKTMRNFYFPARQADQITWLTNFRDKLTELEGALGLTPPFAADNAKDCDWLIYVLQEWLPQAKAWAKSFTATVNQVMRGTGSAATLLSFTPPATATPAQPQGGLTRIIDRVRALKENNLCTEAHCVTLGILGSDKAPPDLDVLKPELEATVKADRVSIEWGWQGNGDFLDMLFMEVDRGDGQGWRPLSSDTTPGYDDRAPFPAALTLWKYRAIYKVGDDTVGLWSAVVSVAVGA